MSPSNLCSLINPLFVQLDKVEAQGFLPALGFVTLEFRTRVWRSEQGSATQVSPARWHQPLSFVQLVPMNHFGPFQQMGCGEEKITEERSSCGRVPSV